MNSKKVEKVTGIAMIVLMVRKLKESVAFYERLGLRLVFHLKDQWAEFSIAGVKIGLCPTKHLRKDYRTGLVLRVDNVQMFYDEQKDVIPFLSEPIEKIHGIMVSFKDPNGNILDLYQSTPDRVQELVKKSKETGVKKQKVKRAPVADAPSPY